MEADTRTCGHQLAWYSATHLIKFTEVAPIAKRRAGPASSYLLQEFRKTAQ